MFVGRQFVNVARRQACFKSLRYLSHNVARSTTKTGRNASFMVGIGTVGCVAYTAHQLQERDCFQSMTYCETKPGSLMGPTKEPSTGILFPHLCDGMSLVGCGVRVKWAFVKVYAVGTYMDPVAMSAVKSQGHAAIEKALTDPTYPRTIRIVMNRNLSIDKYTAVIVEALTPRMNGQDMDKLEQFKSLNPKIDLIDGSVMEMTIRGDTMLYKNCVGEIGQIQSETFCRAMCDVYYGKDPVSSGHKVNVMEGIARM